MDEILRTLPPGARVLDLGCGGGSFRSDNGSFKVIRVDLEGKNFPPGDSARADAAHLPFAGGCFDALISNHSLEHFENLTGSLEEIGRVLKPDGALYVAVPDCTTVTDRLYRWLARGGGHVNGFSSSSELASRIEVVTGMRHVATRTLCTSLSFLNRKSRRAPAPRRLLLLGGGTEPSLLFLTYAFRLIDRLVGTRMSVYGWAFYFGNIPAPVDEPVWTNVCVFCGAGHPSAWLTRRGRLFSTYLCPSCGTRNFFTDDKHYAQLFKAS